MREQFPYDPLSSLIIETLANSIDAKASRIEISIANDGSVYQIMDNGKGMTQNEFVEYHNIASLTKLRGAGIGFAGVGAKIFLDRAEYIVTETKSQVFYGASKWTFANGTPTWYSVSTQDRVRTTGTFVEVKLKIEEDGKKLTSDSIIKVVREHYNAILQGHYKVQNVIINGKRIEQWVPSDIEQRKDFDFRYGGHRIRGFFIKAKNKLPDEFQGPHIVVYGKTIQSNWFKQHPLMGETFTGLILADHLIEILRTSKADFDRTSMLWKYFHAKMGRVLSDWLVEIDAMPRPPTVSEDLDQLARDLEKSINDVLKTPEFAELSRNIFQNIMQRTVGIRSAVGNDMGVEVVGSQTTTGTIGGTGEGGRVVTVGDEEGRGIREDESGETPIERVRRRVRGGIKIGYDDRPDIIIEGWIDLGQQIITINKGHPSFKVAYNLSAETYHVLRCVVNILVKEGNIETPDEVIANIFSKWYERQASG